MVPAGQHIRNKALTRYEATQSFLSMFIFICFSLVCKASQNVCFHRSHVSILASHRMKMIKLKCSPSWIRNVEFYFFLDMSENLKTPGIFLRCLKDLAAYILVQN